MNNKEIKLQLSRNEIGQIIDALCVRIEDWEYTRRYFDEGHEELGREIEECKDACEAQEIAEFYKSILKKIQSQLI